MNIPRLACASFLPLAIVACGGGDSDHSRSASAALIHRANAIQAPAGGGVISQCDTVVSSYGTYTLSGDLTAVPGVDCVSFSGATNATLDCQGHTINAGSLIGVLVDSSRAITIEGCHLQADVTNNGSTIVVKNSGNVTITRNTAAQTPTGPALALDVYSSTGVEAQQNSFAMPVKLMNCRGTYFANNSVYCMEGANECSALIWSQAGAGNAYVNNLLDGEAGHDAPAETAGADDGIVIDGESSDTVSGNTIQNVWDTGIETEDDVSYSTFANNTITNATSSGIGGWWNESFYDNTVSGNYVNGAHMLFKFSRGNGLLPAQDDGEPAQTGIYFENNTFSGNTFVNEYMDMAQGALTMPLNLSEWLFGDLNHPPLGTTPTSSFQFHLSNNTFTNNDFGTVGATSFGTQAVYPGAVIDGGGNICKPGTPTPFPLACATTGFFWGQDYGYPSVSPSSLGDWSPGNYKGQCALGSPVVAVSKAMNGTESHGIECGPPKIDMGTNATGSQCNVRTAYAWDYRGTTDNGWDWDPGSYKTECAANEYVAGISQTGGGVVESILCCPANVAHNSCDAQVYYQGDSQAYAGGNWDPGYPKGQCPNGQYVAGISSPAYASIGTIGAAHAVLCCAP